MNFNSLSCDLVNSKILCRGERNMQQRTLKIDDVKLDGKYMDQKSHREKLNPVYCEYKINADSREILDCHSHSVL